MNRQLSMELAWWDLTPDVPPKERFAHEHDLQRDVELQAKLRLELSGPFLFSLSCFPENKT